MMEDTFEKDHLAKIMQSMYKFLTGTSLCDLTAYVEDQCFHLHKCILASACPLLQYLIVQASEYSQNNVTKVSFTNITATGFKAVLGFIYTGKFPKDKTSQLRTEFVNTCQYLSLPYPCLENGGIKLIEPSEVVHVGFTPMKDQDVIKVILRKGTDLVSVDEGMDCVISSQEVAQVTEITTSIPVYEIERESEKGSVFELNGGVTLTVQKAPPNSRRTHHSTSQNRDISHLSENQTETSNIEAVDDLGALITRPDDVRRTGIVSGQAKEGHTLKKMLFYSADGIVRPYVCHICGTSFTRNYSLKVHLDTVCENRSHVKCLSCKKIFASVSSFKVHARKLHKGEKPAMVYFAKNEQTLVKKDENKHRFQCEKCAAVFTTKQHFTMHHRRCKSVTSAKCPYCKKLFKARKEFDKHMWQCGKSKLDIGSDDSVVLFPVAEEDM